MTKALVRTPLLIAALATIGLGAALVYDGALYLHTHLQNNRIVPLEQGRIYYYDWKEIAIGGTAALVGTIAFIKLGPREKHRLLLPWTAAAAGALAISITVGQIREPMWFTTNTLVRGLQPDGTPGQEIPMRQRYIFGTRIENGVLTR